MAVSFARYRAAALRSTITKIDNRRQLFTTSYYIAWALLLTAFVVIGGRELWIGSHGNFLERGPLASTDAYLEALLNLRNGSTRSIDVMSAFYGKREFVYFCPRRSAEGDFVFDVLSYLSWPQQIRKIEADGAELKERLDSIDRANASAFIFFALKPPPECSRGLPVGPKLWVASIDSP